LKKRGYPEDPRTPEALGISEASATDNIRMSTISPMIWGYAARAAINRFDAPL
jgi:hypothetical protein